MEGYELVFITDPEVNDKDLLLILKKFKKNLKDSGGKLIHEIVWGHRRLAYEINGLDYGLYHAWYFTGSGKTVDELQRQFGYSDNILRNQIVKTNDIDADVSFLNQLKLPKDNPEEVKGKKSLTEEYFEEDLVESEGVNQEEEKTDKKEGKVKVKSEV